MYALLDTQSNTTFVSQDTTDSLKVVTEPVRLKLTTMTSNTSIIHFQRVTGLSVRVFTSATRIHLPPAYTRDVIPVNRSHIPTDETARRWSHLASIADELQPLKGSEVGLLIGYDCEQALAPRQVITGKDSESYAQRTDLGWSIVGCATPRLNWEDVTGLSHRITVLQTSNSFLGPEFLWETEIINEQESPLVHSLLLDHRCTCISSVCHRVKNVQVYATEATEQFRLVRRLLRFSDWYKVVRAIARLITRVTQETKPSNNNTTVTARRDAELFIKRRLKEVSNSLMLRDLGKRQDCLLNPKRTR